jgi:glycosyltransferase involved in cell wall biosynthesis
MRLTIVQYAGDYREAWERLDAGGKETYQAQRYSVDLVGRLAQHLEEIAVICAVSEVQYDVTLPNGVRAIGAGLPIGFRRRDLVPILAQTAPDRLWLTSPMTPLLKWARKRQVRTMTALADSFGKRGPKLSFTHRFLARELNDSNVQWVGNHGIGACLSLLDVGVQPEKIIPWDWPPSHQPGDFSPRQFPGGRTLKLVYVGAIEEAKGVSDLLRAVRQLKNEGEAPLVTIIGRDRDGRMSALANTLGVKDEIQFAGVIPNEDVPAAMREADAVVIPSRHEYPEGLPLTIYEALAARTPIIASDHPMFAGALVHEQSALNFAAGDAGALASAIVRLSRDNRLYAELSLNSAEAWQALQLPVSWGEMLQKWLSDTPADREWLRAHRLESGLYDRQIEIRRST